MTPEQFAAWVDDVCRLTTIDRLKIWPTAYGAPFLWVSYALARDNGNPHPRFRCSVRFMLN